MSVDWPFTECQECGGDIYLIPGETTWKHNDDKDVPDEGWHHGVPPEGWTMAGKDSS